MLIVIVRLLIHAILTLLFDYYIDITACSIVKFKGNCIIHNRNCNHGNSDGNYSNTLISRSNHSINCYQQQQAYYYYYDHNCHCHCHYYHKHNDSDVNDNGIYIREMHINSIHSYFMTFSKR